MTYENNKPRTREAFIQAMEDMKSEIETLKRIFNQNPYETFVVGFSYLNTIEQRELNKLLGLTSNEGIESWYS